MRIGIIGLGVVGSACKFGFEKLGHRVSVHDIKLDTKLSDVLETEIIYICVPTPSNEDGSCDTSIVESCVQDLHKAKYKGIVAIKSTVTPGTTKRLSEIYFSLRIVFVPEFLRERCAIYDFVENNNLLAVGASSESDYLDIVKSHGSYPKNHKRLGFTEAELLKYFSNIFNALKIIFANEMFEISKFLCADYREIKSAYLMYSKCEDKYLDVNDNFRGYAGICLPKDVKAIAYLCKKHNLSLDLFRMLDSENEKFIKTVPNGMRL